MESTLTYMVESQAGPVLKNSLATEPFPGAKSPPIQAAKIRSLFLALFIYAVSLLMPASAALVPTKLIESQMISRLVAESGKAIGIANPPKCSSLII